MKRQIEAIDFGNEHRGPIIESSDPRNCINTTDHLECLSNFSQFMPTQMPVTVQLLHEFTLTTHHITVQNPLSLITIPPHMDYHFQFPKLYQEFEI